MIEREGEKMENEDVMARKCEPANVAGQPAAESIKATPHDAERIGFTPGPWSVGAHLHSRRFNNDNAVEVQDAHASMVAVLFKCNRSMDENGEDAANARLVSAAPDLLEAAKQACDWCDQGGLMDWALIVKFRDALRAAIAKAEGRK